MRQLDWHRLPSPAASGAAGAGDEGGDTGSHSGLDNHTEIGDIIAMMIFLFVIIILVLKLLLYFVHGKSRRKKRTGKKE